MLEEHPSRARIGYVNVANQEASQPKENFKANLCRLILTFLLGGFLQPFPFFLGKFLILPPKN